MKQLSIIAIFSFLALVGCKQDRQDNKTVNQSENNTTTTQATSKKAVATMNSKSGSKVNGTIKFTQMGDEVMMTASLNGFEGSGEHAIHIHENGDCSSEDAKSAGDHWNPTHENHGKWGDEDFHLGDIGNLSVSDEGTVSMTFSTDQWSLDASSDNYIGNKSVIVHAKSDDFNSQPSGAAGTRIACGIIQVTE